MSALKKMSLFKCSFVHSVKFRNKTNTNIIRLNTTERMNNMKW